MESREPCGYRKGRAKLRGGARQQPRLNDPGALGSRRIFSPPFSHADTSLWLSRNSPLGLGFFPGIPSSLGYNKPVGKSAAHFIKSPMYLNVFC